MLLAALTWVSFVAAPRTLGWDGLAAFYLAWALPATLGLTVELLWPGAFGRALRRRQVSSSATAARTSPSAT